MRKNAFETTVALLEQSVLARYGESGSPPPTNLREMIAGMVERCQDLVRELEDQVLPCLTPIEREMHQRMQTLVLGSAGEIEDHLFVTKPGILLLTEEPRLTDPARQLFADLHLSQDTTDAQQLVHFKTAVTNLTFPKGGKNTERYLEQVVRKAAHRSVVNDVRPVFLLAGIAAETALELIAHKEGDIGRLTSSATSAMRFPHFEINGEAWERLVQKVALLEHLLNHRKLFALSGAVGTFSHTLEYQNRLHPGNKALALVFSMGLKDIHKMLIGRLAPQGNEAALQEVCTRMCTLLNQRHPQFIETPEWYRDQGNGAKYGERKTPSTR